MHPAQQASRDAPSYDYRRYSHYDDLPDFALVKIREVMVLVGLSISGMERLIRDGKFPPPHFQGNTRVWHLGVIREYCRLAGAQQQAFIDKMKAGE